MPRLAALALLPVFALTLPALAADKEKEARKKEAEKRFVKLKDYCKERRATHIVELLAEWGEFADANQQDQVLEFTNALFDDVVAVLKAEARPSGIIRPQVGYRGVSATSKVKKAYSEASAYFVDTFECIQPAPQRDFENVPGKHMIVASRTLNARPNHRALECIVLTNATTAEFQGLHRCIVIASGNLMMEDDAVASVVVCRGDVSFHLKEKESSLMWIGGKVSDTNPSKITNVKQPDSDWLFPNDKKLLGVKFYSAAEDGLEATAAKGVVTVSKVDETKPFGKAGVKAGDVIETINGEKVPSLHELDRLMCRATVASGVAKLKLKRGDKAEEIEVTLFDWSSYTPDKKK